MGHMPGCQSENCGLTSISLGKTESAILLLLMLSLCEMTCDEVKVNRKGNCTAEVYSTAVYLCFHKIIEKKPEWFASSLQIRMVKLIRTDTN